MSICIDEMEPLKIYNRQLYLPVNDDDRKNNSAIFLLTPNLTSSKKLMDLPRLFKGQQNFKGYYVERDISYFIQNESFEMERCFDHLILEEGNLEVLSADKNHLSSFNRIDITQESLDHHYSDTDKLIGIIELFPWKGYLYLDECGVVVAALNVNTDTKEIDTLFVTKEEYNYLYPDLLSEARKLKANTIVLANNESSIIKSLEEFGFTKTEDYQDSKSKYAFKIPISESSDDNNKLKTYLNDYNSKYVNWRFSRSIDIFYKVQESNAVYEIAKDFCKNLKLDKDICLLMSRAFNMRDNAYEIADFIKNDTKLLKYLNQTQISLAAIAIVEYKEEIKPSNIYTRVLSDSVMLAHRLDVDTCIKDSLDWYKDENGNNEITMDDIPAIIDYMQGKYGNKNLEYYMLDYAYPYYKKNFKNIQKEVHTPGRLHSRIVSNEKITESAKTPDVSSRLLTESHVAFTDMKECFIDINESTNWDKNVSNESKFIQKSTGKSEGLVLTVEDSVMGALKVDSTGRITEMCWERIDPNQLLLTAIKKYGANKIRVYKESKLFDTIKENPSWNIGHIYQDKSVEFYTKEQKFIYPDIPIDEESKVIYESLSNQDKHYLGNQYINNNCISNTIYRKSIKECGLIDAYQLPDFGDNIACLDIAVTEKARGKGYAKRLINECINDMKKDYKNIDFLLWICESENQPSYNLAIKTGFTPHHESNGFRFLYKTITDIKTPIPLQESFNVDDLEYINEDTNIQENFSYILENISIHDNNTYMILQEEADKALDKYNSNFKKILYDDRIKTTKDQLRIYEDIKEDNHNITMCYDKLDKYKGKNIYFDMSYYNISFFNNFSKSSGTKTFKARCELYIELLRRIVTKNKYKKKTIFVPITDWITTEDEMEAFDYKTQFNPLSSMMFYIRFDKETFNRYFKNIDFLFMTNSGYTLRLDPNTLINNDDYIQVTKKFKMLLSKEVEIDKDKDSSTTKAIVHSVSDKLETSRGVVIHNILGNATSKINKSEGSKYDNRDKEKTIDDKKKEVVDIIAKNAEGTNNDEEAIDVLDQSEEKERLQDLLASIESEEEDNVKINAARTKRMEALTTSFHNKKIRGKSIKEMLAMNKSDSELPEKELKIDSIDEDWKHLQFTNFEEQYDIDADIMKIMNHFSKVTVPIAVRDVKVDDTSTSGDWKYTYDFDLEDVNGKRFKFKFDIPKFKSNRFMRIGGNDKTISGQLVLLPISKTEMDTVQMISNYNKIFIRRKGNGVGKSTVDADRLVKILEDIKDKYKKNVSIHYGDNTFACSKYELPYDYLDIASEYSEITLTSGSKMIKIFLNRDIVKNEVKIKEDTKNIPYMYDSKKQVYEYSLEDTNSFSRTIINRIINFIIQNIDPKFDFNKYQVSNKHMYSEASILSADIPIIVIMAYCEGLQRALKKGNIKYTIEETRRRCEINEDVIKFADAYLFYQCDYEASLLMNGLSMVETKTMSIRDIDKKTIWTEVLDDFGGRIKADGLDNFYDLMMDPITVEVCEEYNMPTDFCSALAYSNDLLVDTTYVNHTDLASNRYRTNELVAGYAYKCISYAYSQYRNQLKRDRSVHMTMKQSAIIDAIMMDPTESDLSINDPLLEMEAMNSVSYKGLTGMNSDRSYSLDKRTYSDSMINHVAISTGFAGNVGTNRWSTINMAIKGTRGYIKNSGKDKMGTTNTLCMTEALTPYGINHDDPFRSAMTFIQTSKHSTRINNAVPMLISSGADMALPYLTSDTFSFKAKQAGKVKECNKDYIIVEYKDKTTEMIDLRERVEKNSDGGFFILMKLDSDLKKGSTFKQGDILAYDKTVYNNEVGDQKNIAFSMAALGNVAFLDTEECFEDSAVCSDRLAERLTSTIVAKIDKLIPANTDISYLVKIGKHVEEGETIMLYQTPFEDEDANVLVRNLSMDEKEIKEIGKIPVKAKYTGTIQDIKLYRTVDTNQLSPSLKKIFKEYESNIKRIKSAKEKNKCKNDVDLEADYTLPASGKLKKCDGKVLVEIYLKYNDKFSVGDKLVYYSAAKGVDQFIFPKGKEPYTDRRPDETIDCFAGSDAITRRMIGSIRIVSGLYKVLMELDKQVKETLGIPYKSYFSKDFKPDNNK